MRSFEVRILTKENDETVGVKTIDLGALPAAFIQTVEEVVEDTASLYNDAVSSLPDPAGADAVSLSCVVTSKS